MPYIDPGLREKVRKLGPTNAGELNYIITYTVRSYIGSHYNYATYNEVMGVFVCAMLELYRRMVAGHEDQKCKENGDVYDDYTPIAGW